MKNYFKNDASDFKCRGENCCGGMDFTTQKQLNALNNLRHFLGVPLRVTSGSRCIKHNSETPGASKTSDHTKGNATDVYSPKATPKQIGVAGKQWFKQIIMHDNFCHLGKPY